MSITLTPTQLAWVNLPADQKARFENIAAKDGDPDMDAYDWFEHLVPEPIQDQPEMVDVFMDGGTVTQEVYVPAQGRAGGQYEQVEYTVSDKDVSRIQSGKNGGEYTKENTVMEDASANRSRGAEDMTPEELQDIQEANQLEAEMLESAEVLQDSAAENADVLMSATEATDTVLDAVLDGVLPATYGARVAHYAWTQTSDMEAGERIATTALVGGGGVLATYGALSLVPGLNLVLGGIAVYKLTKAGIHYMEKQA